MNFGNLKIFVLVSLMDSNESKDGAKFTIDRLCRGFTSIRKQDNQVVFEVTASAVRSSMPGGFEWDFFIHPTTLDACFQIMSVPISKLNEVPNQIWIPSTIKLSTIRFPVTTKFFTVYVNPPAVVFAIWSALS